MGYCYEKGGAPLTDKKIISELIKAGLKKMESWPEPEREKKAIIIGQIAKAVNCKIKTVENARSRGFGEDKSLLLRIYAKEKGVIKRA